MLICVSLTGELLHQANQNLPGECGSLSHSLPLLLERAAGHDAAQRMRATQAITALLMLARARLNSPSSPTSLYLAHIIRCSPKAKERIPKVYSPSTSAKFSKVGIEHWYCYIYLERYQSNDTCNLVYVD